MVSLGVPIARHPPTPSTTPPCIRHDYPSLRIQVIIPSRCRPAAAARCLAALSTQSISHSDYEVLLVDDGSPQPLVIDPLTLPPTFRFRLIHKQQSGPAGARQFGAHHSQADILLFIDDDCIPAPDWIESMARAVESTPQALVGGTTWNGAAFNRQARVNQLILDLVYQHFNPVGGPATFFASNNIACRRADFLKLGGFDPDFPLPAAEDRDLCDRWRAQGWPLVHAPLARVEHRHIQSIPQFLRMYFRYGRGARILHAKRLQRGARGVREDIGFHQRIPGQLGMHFRGMPYLERLAVLALLAGWQFANAAGFAWEAVFGSKAPAPVAQTDSTRPCP